MTRDETLDAVLERCAGAGTFDPAALRHFLHEILEWNTRAGLVSKASPAETLSRLVRQSVEMWTLAGAAAEGVAFVDVGSGGGFPGVIWALLAPAATGLLVERKEKKAVFLARTVRVLGLDAVEVAAEDALDAVGTAERRGRFDVAGALAVGHPEKTAALTMPFLRPGGCFVTTFPLGPELPPDHPVPGLSLESRRESDTESYLLYRRA